MIAWLVFPVPVTVNLYGRSSSSSLGIVTVAVLLPTDEGVKLMVKLVVLLPDMGELVVLLSEKSLEPDRVTLGSPVK